MAILRTTLPCPTQLSSTKHHVIITNSFDFDKKKHYSPDPFFSSSLRLSVTHTPTLIITTKQHFNSTLRFASTSEQQVTTQEQTEELSTTRLLAQNVPWSSTTEDVRSLFEKYGKVLHVELSMYNKNRNRGLAFVEMGSPEEASEALNSLQSYEFDGRIINIQYAKPKKEKIPPPVERKPITYNLFVANFPYEARSKDVKEFFDSGTGKVVSAEVIFHENPRRPSGYGFVSYKSKKEADEALAEFQGKNFMGRPLRVAPSKRFVQLAEESAGSEDTSSELSVNEAEADKTD
ncbi:putative nucleotide-binding alpha-beta plait domain-containing protein [Medicago truncatula]|uniref:Putative nucleotide-binding alpha-beta plait domain-containing protein n=1 Tax=Medicago truncatula TaxID=3880 RepID=G7J4G2_MEDTR|nr:28 kDa ribonucleoprotein, chloroplastic [Medicago truncatula]XP_024633804.1 28 kDa ribonucleoprotein, chloroplastic [Medicago truncatula]AES73098.1 RNA recognition motif [Medicago truncatula]RHN70147.1 putative nucleotide-binding alpha-beta plait domain-containing protein [Medicago truncatula]